MVSSIPRSYPIVSVYNSTYAVRPDNDPATEFVYNPATGHSLAAVCVFGDYHCMATFYGGSSISFRRSEDAGETWDDQGGIGPLFSGSPIGLAGHAYGGIDRLILAYRSNPFSSCRYAVAYSDDVGETWAHTYLYSGGGPAGGLMDMCLDQTNGYIYITYATEEGWYLAKSVDGGETWLHRILPATFGDSPYLNGRLPIAMRGPYGFICSGDSWLEEGSLGQPIRKISVQSFYTQDYGVTWIPPVGGIAIDPSSTWDGTQGLSHGWFRCGGLSIGMDNSVHIFLEETKGYISIGIEYGFMRFLADVVGPFPSVSLPQYDAWPDADDYLPGTISVVPQWNAPDVPPFAVASFRRIVDEEWEYYTFQWPGHAPQGNELVVAGDPGVVGPICDGPSLAGSHSFWW